jgi:cytosine/adenosine deaminase-related metal-dependent hydrolase
MSAMPGTAAVSCHVERPLDDAVWSAFERLLRRRPAGFVVTPFMRPPDESEAGESERWLERARRASSLAPLGHHTHWGGAARARPTDDVDPARKVRDEAEWLRSHGLAPRYFCGGGWYLDAPVAETLAAQGYVDCTATTFRQSYLDAGAPRLQLTEATRLVLPSGATLTELPATHSLGMLARAARLPRHVHVHFHDWELRDRKRAASLWLLLHVLAARRRPQTIAELEERAAAAPERAWDGGTIT